MASITFTDATGTATLTNGKPAPMDRFNSWTPFTVPYGDPARRQSDMRLVLFELGTMYGAGFELRKIPVQAVGGTRYVTVALRLIAHLLRGGTCSVATDDAVSSTYATCGLAPDADPSLVLSDPKQLEYTLALRLINLAAVPTHMVCHYR